ncbi:glutathione peroxidase [Alteromonas sp. ASW11-19]|uniref:Glutathione peroxidase n=1 Tax=Alteromonas salexigens TaxID=2982530 RepID=A0ABT2VMW5_9ALTE|nr:glutathione peroxidase [Alteromonas salexigens]MCU7554228.1 glutathione peroxidase [Alteromonas salexigens]
MSTSLYEITATRNSGETESMSAYQGQVLLIVNTASECGFTYQYEGLQSLYDTFNKQGFQVLAFPCDQFGHQEPGSDEEIASFCTARFGVEFPLFSKIDVNGPDTHPLYAYLKQAAPGLLGTTNIKWNFTKFLISKSGDVIKRYGPTVKPDKLDADIRATLAG